MNFSLCFFSFEGISFEDFSKSGVYDLLAQFRSLADSKKEQESIIDTIPGLREKLGIYLNFFICSNFNYQTPSFKCTRTFHFYQRREILKY